jgi:putative zinc finger/helix-turn-helix YgiT family protein
MPYTCDVAHDGRTYQIEIPEIDIPKCQACGTLVITNSVDDQLIQALRVRVGLLTPEQIRSGREALGLKSKELAEKLGVAAETLSRWENGGLIQSRAMDNYLRVYFAVPKVREALLGSKQNPSLGTIVTAGSEPMNGDKPINATALDVFTPAYAQRAEQLFLRPREEYRWNEIVNGVCVRRENAPPEWMYAVDGNTVRGLHKISKDKWLPGPKELFQRYFTEQQDRLIRELIAVSNRDGKQGLYQLSNQICNEIRDELRGNIKPDRLTSYNRTRKPVDLYLEHLVAMAVELKEHRERLVPLLYLPLDSWMFNRPHLFTEQELDEHDLNRASKFGHVKDEKTYQALQQIVDRRAGEVSRRVGWSFQPIYFDLLWGNPPRYQNKGRNLFETNPLKNRRCA